MKMASLMMADITNRGNIEPDALFGAMIENKGRLTAIPTADKEGLLRDIAYDTELYAGTEMFNQGMNTAPQRLNSAIKQTEADQDIRAEVIGAIASCPHLSRTDKLRIGELDAILADAQVSQNIGAMKAPRRFKFFGNTVEDMENTDGLEHTVNYKGIFIKHKARYTAPSDLTADDQDSIQRKQGASNHRGPSVNDVAQQATFGENVMQARSGTGGIGHKYTTGQGIADLKDTPFTD
jgi:hypothetical protein